jgi:hypothetical protein
MAAGHHIAGVQGIWRPKSYQQSPHTGRRYTQKGNETTREGGSKNQPGFGESVNKPLEIFTREVAFTREDEGGTKD